MKEMISKMMKQKMLGFSVIVLTLALGILIGTTITTGVSAASGQAVADAKPLVIPPVTKLSNDFTKLAKMMEPSVVFIETEYAQKMTAAPKKRSPQAAPDEEEDPMDMFHRFFEGPGQGPGPQTPRRFKRQGSGSGFIVDKNGYIMTNMHVVDEADKIMVKVPGDKEEYKAKLIGSDVETDIAIIKIEAGKPLPPVKIANSDSVQVGDWAVAIGAPFGLEASVTAGIVSATGRDVSAQQFQRFIQTDAAINPGNSGGPLVNINGEVIGVNTMIATSSGGYQGIGFALPMNMAAKVYNQVIQYGRVTRGSIGIRFAKKTEPATLKALGIQNGVIVDSVAPGGPAEKAGLKREDVIVALNGKPVADGDDLVARISDTPVGTDVNLQIDREGQKLEKKVTVLDRQEVFKDDPRFSKNQPEMTDPGAGEGEKTARFGIGIRALSEEQRKEMSFPESGGVVVTVVEEGSFADEIGVREKDIIVSINRKPVSSYEDVKKIQATLKSGDAVAFRVMRQFPGSRRGETQWVGQYLSGTLPKE